jgi:hypothetical protein
MTTMQRRLKDLTPEDQRALPYDLLLRLRREAYTEHVKAMTIPPAMASWATDMAARHGPEVKVWHNTMGWLEAFMVVRYGEEPSSWPREFSPLDLLRVERWQKGQQPAGVTILPQAAK